MLSKCSNCGCESEIDLAFRKYRPRRSKTVQLLCPNCWGERFKSRSKVFWGIVAIAFLAALTLYFIDPKNNISRSILNLIVIYIFTQLVIIPHELGHVLMGRLSGFTIFMVSVGYGNVFLKGRFLGVRWEIRPWPFGSMTVLASHSLRFYRLRNFFGVLGGPMVNFIFILLASWLPPEVSSKFNFRSLGVPIIFDFFLANAFVLFINLLPGKSSTMLGAQTDGLTLLTLPFLSKKEVEQRHMGYFWLRASELHWLKQFRQSIKVCEEGLLLYPDSVPLKILLGTILLDVNEEERARNLFIALLECTDITNEQRVILLNNTAYTNVLMNRKDLLAEADRYSEQAYRNAPWSLAIQGTRGAVLVEIGKIEEGLTLLRKAFNEHTEEKMKAIGAAHIAIGEKQRGNREEAIRYYNTAYKLDPNIPILNRLKEELEM